MSEMTNESLVERGLDYYERNGLVRTVGAVAKYLGEEIHDRCRTGDRILRQVQDKDYPLAIRLHAVRHGTSSLNYLWFGRDDADPNEYLLSNDLIAEFNADHISQVHDKYVFQLMTEPRLGALPTLYGTVRKGTFSTATTRDEDLDDLIERVDQFVFKPTQGGKGEGIYLVTRTGDGIVVNVAPLTISRPRF